MGNQQSAGIQYCSSRKLHTERSQNVSYKSDVETRVGYTSTKTRCEVQRAQKPHQQVTPQQQNQEELAEIPVHEPGILKILKSYFETHQDDEETIRPKTTKKSFNVYISCLDLEGEVEKQDVVFPRSEPKICSEILQYFKDDVAVFEGVFGNVIINKKNGLVLYTDITGRRHCEVFERDEIVKIFPMGVSQGGLTKTIWLKDAAVRDGFFDLMKMAPPSYNAVMKNPTKFRFSQTHDGNQDDDNLRVFEGINNNNVIVHSENVVLYTDLDENKHCVEYNKHKVLKCFPNGIYYGGLPRTIWFNDEIERDLCYTSMQWNMENHVEEPDETVRFMPHSFVGLYGSVVLHPDSQIEFTSLTGVRVKCFYEPTEIQDVFPNGISYGRLPNSIWFKNEKERGNCVTAMRNM